MNNWKVIFASLVIFGAGVVTGGLLVSHTHPSRSRSVHPHPVAPAEAPAPVANPAGRPPENARLRPPEILSKQFLQRLTEELRLSPDQHDAIQKIIGERQNQMRKVVQDTRLEIREELRPDQQQQFDELVKRPVRRPPPGTNSPPPAAASPAAVSTNSP